MVDALKKYFYILLRSGEVRRDVKSWIYRSCNAEFKEKTARFEL
jgi:hypothetical protein